MEAHKVKCPHCKHENPPSKIYCEECGEMLIHIQYSRENPPKTGEESSVPPESPEVSASAAQPSKPPSQELKPRSIFASRYKILEKVGEGRTGFVYKALDSKSGEEVALKLIKSEVVADDKAFKRIQKEFKPARKLSHKHICRMYHMGTFKGSRYVTMDFVSGEDLKSSIQRMGQFTFRKALFTAKQICAGLAEAHRSGLLHRNLKPQNIMVDEFGNVRIMEFGLSGLKSLGDTKITGKRKDADAYRSPEQLRGEEVDQRSDIYSLGLILYEMLTTRLPITGEIPLSFAKEQQIPGGLSRLILKCLVKEKENRIQSAKEMLTELERIDTGAPYIEKEIPQRRPAAAKKRAVRLDIQKLLVPGLIVAAAAAIAILLWQLFFVDRIGSISESKPSLAVVHFENDTADENLDYWGTMISEAIIADLNQSKYLEVLSSETLYGILSDLNQLKTNTYAPAVLKQVARQGGVDYIMYGNYSKEGDTVRIRIFLMNKQKEKPIASWSDEGRGEESLFTMVDGLTLKLKERFKIKGERLSDDLDREASRITTGSLEAFRIYLDGHRHYLEGKYRQSTEEMERAIAIDPGFALAFKSLSMSYARLSLSAQRDESIQKVFDLSDRISEKELYTLQGDFFRESEETYDKSVDAYTRLLELYPDDAASRMKLGSIYLDAEDFDKALEQFEQIKGSQAEAFNTFAIKADIFMMQGLYDKAEEVLRNYLNSFSNKSWTHHFLAFNYIADGNSYFAQNEIDQAIALDPQNPLSRYLRGVYLTLTDSFVEAENEYKTLLERKDPSGSYLGYHGLANLELVQGKLGQSRKYLAGVIELSQKIGVPWIGAQARSILALRLLESGLSRDALRQCDLALESATAAKRQDLQRLALHYKGLAYVSSRSLSRAQGTADQLKELIEKGSHTKEIRRYHHLVGMIELEKKNYPLAIENLELALSLLPYQSSLDNQAYTKNSQALFIHSLALAYYRSGNLKKAVEEYEKINGLTTGRLFFGGIFARSFYTVGRIYQRLGENSKAEENYNKFLALWFNADSSISEVYDAKRRVSALNRRP
jgi:serine/threonine protein kinase/Tfp pilus assembly protein PilF